MAEDIKDKKDEDDSVNSGVAGEASAAESSSVADADMANAADVESESEAVMEEDPADAVIEDEPAAKKPNKILPLVLLAVSLILLTALGALGYVLYTTLENQKTVSADAAQARAKLSHIESQISVLNEELSGAQQQIQQTIRNELQSEIQKQDKSTRAALAKQSSSISQLESSVTSRLDGQQNRLAMLSATSREDWKLAEAEYLMKLASQRVLLENSPVSAIALLEAADKIIQEVASDFGDPELFAIRKALTNELTALRLVTPIDRNGLYLQLQALADEAAGLPPTRLSALENTATEFSQSAAEDQTAQGGGVWAEIKSMFGSIGQYIKIESSDAPLNPVLDWQEAQLTAFNIRILIQQAQVALLKEQPAPYQSSLASAEDLVTSRYPDSPKTQRYLERLQKLSEQTIVVELPDISKSLQLLHAYIEQTHKLPAKNAAP